MSFKPLAPRLLAVLALFACFALQQPTAHAWGNEGHRLINRLAAGNLPADMPEFLRSKAAIEEIEYLGPEPDRWRSPAEPELVAAQAPEHFIDFEPADALGPLPHKRLDFEAKVFAAGERPEKIGLQPWVTDGSLGAFEGRHAPVPRPGRGAQDTRQVEDAILFYVGWLGHYVGDGSQPLHTTIQYNGWVGAKSQRLHHRPSRFTGSLKGRSSAANIHAPEVLAQMTPAKAIDGDIFDAYVAYLRHTSTYVEKVYQLEKAGGFTGEGTPESRDFTAERVAAGASMLRDMIYTAWVDSGVPVKDPYAGK